MKKAIWTVPLLALFVAASAGIGPTPQKPYSVGQRGYMLGDRIWTMLGDAGELGALEDRCDGLDASHPRAIYTEYSYPGTNTLSVVKADPFANSSTGVGLWYTTRYESKVTSLSVSAYCDFSGPTTGAEKGWRATVFGVAPDLFIAPTAPGISDVAIYDSPAGSTPNNPQDCTFLGGLGGVAPSDPAFLGLNVASGMLPTTGQYWLAVEAQGNDNGDPGFGSLSFYDFNATTTNTNFLGRVNGVSFGDFSRTFMDRISDISSDGGQDLLVATPDGTTPRVRLLDPSGPSQLGVLELPVSGFGMSVHAAKADLDGLGEEDFYVGSTDQIHAISTEAVLAAMGPAGPGAVIRTINAPQMGVGFGDHLFCGFFNADAVHDVGTSAPLADPGGRDDAGSLFLFDGTDGSLIDRIDGQRPGDRLGDGIGNHTVASLGDLGRQDGIDELVATTPGGNNGEGDMYLQSSDVVIGFKLHIGDRDPLRRLLQALFPGD